MSHQNKIMVKQDTVQHSCPAYCLAFVAAFPPGLVQLSSQIKRTCIWEEVHFWSTNAVIGTSFNCVAKTVAFLLFNSIFAFFNYYYACVSLHRRVYTSKALCDYNKCGLKEPCNLLLWVLRYLLFPSSTEAGLSVSEY